MIAAKYDALSAETKYDDEKASQRSKKQPYVSAVLPLIMPSALGSLSMSAWVMSNNAITS
jgi:hypothetical protein